MTLLIASYVGKHQRAEAIPSIQQLSICMGHRIAILKLAKDVQIDTGRLYA